MTSRACVVALTAVLGIAVLGGCATFNDTPAQDLARTRIQRCNRYPTVMPQEVRADGSITVLTYGAGAVSEYPAWRRCMDEVLTEQRKAGLIPSDAQPAIVDVKGR
jgi:hypothetical protein